MTNTTFFYRLIVLLISSSNVNYVRVKLVLLSYPRLHNLLKGSVEKLLRVLSHPLRITMTGKEPRRNR